jgi:O-antigen/teichoic acid export membrane protein
LQGFWAIADQGVVSLGNFLTTIILARTVSPQEYGVWTVTYGLILFLNVLPASLITYPLIVRLASHNEDSAGQLIVAALALTTLLALPQMLVLFCVSSLIGGRL